MSSRRWIALVLSIAALLAASPAFAQLGMEIARAHAQRAGDKLAALHSLRIEGRTFLAGEMTLFVQIAERPNRLRVESFTPLRRVVQVYDGKNPPWISHTDTRLGAAEDMPAADAAEFIASADFVGPLVDPARKGYSVDYAGEETIEGRAARKLLVMGKRDEIFFLWVDAANHEIVKRLVYRTERGRRVAIETRYSDFRPVAGVLQPFRVETLADGVTLYGMVVDKMAANEPVPDGTFARP